MNKDKILYEQEKNMMRKHREAHHIKVRRRKEEQEAKQS